MGIYEAYEAYEMPDGYPFSGMTTRIQYTEPALPGGDAGCFPAAHPRETLDAEYAVWSDQVNPGWTMEETIIALRNENEKLWIIIRDLQNRLYDMTPKQMSILAAMGETR